MNTKRNLQIFFKSNSEKKRHIFAEKQCSNSDTGDVTAATGSSLTRTRGHSIRNPGVAERPETEPEAAVPAMQYTINLTAEATWLLMRRYLKNQRGWMNPFGGTGLLPGSQSRAGLDLTSLMQISLLNEQNRYDDEEYEEDPAPGVVDQELVHRCTEWLRGVEEVKRGQAGDPAPPG